MHGFISFKQTHFSGAGMKYLEFEKWLNKITNNKNIDAVYYESVNRHIGTYAAHNYGGYMAILIKFCEEKNIPYKGVPVTVIKKHIAGKGNANKKDVVDAVNKNGFNVSDDNEADAIALYSFVECESA